MRIIELILNMVNQNVQEALKKFQDNRNKEYKKAQEKHKINHRSPV
jgi:hypothetical protein